MFVVLTIAAVLAVVAHGQVSCRHVAGKPLDFCIVNLPANSYYYDCVEGSPYVRNFANNNCSGAPYLAYTMGRLYTSGLGWECGNEFDDCDYWSKKNKFYFDAECEDLNWMAKDTWIKGQCFLWANQIVSWDCNSVGKPIQTRWDYNDSQWDDDDLCSDTADVAATVPAINPFGCVLKSSLSYDCDGAFTLRTHFCAVLALFAFFVL